MSAWSGKGETWRENHAARELELDQLQPASLQYATLRGTCEGCGAPWVSHSLQNALAKGINDCSYCGRTR